MQTVRDLVIDFATSLKKSVDNSKNLAIVITPTFDNDRVTMYISAYNKTNKDFSVNLAYISYYALGEDQFPILAAIGNVKAEIITQQGQLETYLNKVLTSENYAKQALKSILADGNKVSVI